MLHQQANQEENELPSANDESSITNTKDIGVADETRMSGEYSTKEGDMENPQAQKEGLLPEGNEVIKKVFMFENIIKNKESII